MQQSLGRGRYDFRKWIVKQADAERSALTPVLQADDKKKVILHDQFRLSFVVLAPGSMVAPGLAHAGTTETIGAALTASYSSTAVQ
jgi:hypothetical protein